ncbi:apoptosis-associated speck-like protein containing a CARD [Anableps anableps]
MAPKSSKRILKNALKKLTDEEFKDFIEELLDRKDGVVKHLVLGKDRMDVANVMTTHYTEDNVVSVTIEIFKEMSLHQQVKELAEEAQNAGVGLSAPAPVVTAVVAPQQAAQAANPAASDGTHFVDKHRIELIKRVGNIGPILDRLLDKGVIKMEAYNEIEAQPSKEKKIKKLIFDYLNSTTGKDIFYNILKEEELFLIDELEKK